MVVHGGYTDAEVDVLCESLGNLTISSVDILSAQAYVAEIDKGQLYTRYHALSVTK
jgi:hypothetical protein